MLTRIFPLLALPLALLGCTEGSAPTVLTESSVQASTPAGGPSTEDLLKDVRRVTARFHSTTQALAAGFEPTDHCVPGMGYHWVNPSRMDPTFDPLQPEILIYASGPNGQRRLVAVEYIVMDVGQPRPSFGSYPLDIGGTPVPVPHFSLHVWLYAENPHGIFAPHNPAITCEH